MATPGILPTEEYNRRKAFVDDLKALTRAEHIEIVRILQTHRAQFSENQNGVFFNVSVLDQEVFDALELFLNFTRSNHRNLADRDQYIHTLKTDTTANAPRNT